MRSCGRIASGQVSRATGANQVVGGSGFERQKRIGTNEMPDSFMLTLAYLHSVVKQQNSIAGYNKLCLFFDQSEVSPCGRHSLRRLRIHWGAVAPAFALTRRFALAARLRHAQRGGRTPPLCLLYSGKSARVFAFRRFKGESGGVKPVRAGV